jgi:hypothetical protein
VHQQTKAKETSIPSAFNMRTIISLTFMAAPASGLGDVHSSFAPVKGQDAKTPDGIANLVTQLSSGGAK